MPRAQHIRRSLHPSRRLLLVAVLLVVLAVLLALVIRPGPKGPGSTPPPAPEPTEQEFVHHFAPLYQLRDQEKNCDRYGEAFLPSPVELVIGGAPGISLNEPGARPIAGPVPADLAAASGEAFLDYPGDPRRPGCRYERDFRLLSEGLAPTVYARIAREPGREGFVLQYWAFYYLNDWNNVHEGDWEMVQLVFEDGTLAEALAEGPVYVVYAQHGGAERADWGSGKLKRAGDRPIVFVSAGSHASYFSPATYLGLGEAGTGFGCDITLPPHRVVDPAVAEFREQGDSGEVDAWLTYAGRWGQRLGGEFNGPTGPQTKRAWREPVSWAEGARGGSATLPASDLFGVNSVHAFCGAVEGGSKLLRAYMQFPTLVGGAVVAVLGMVAVTGIVVLRDLARPPLVGAETSGFLRHRRSLGQMIRASILVYRRHARLFLGISFTFIPLHLLLSLAHPWIASLPLFERVLWLMNANQVSELLIGLLAGGIASLAVYFVVLSATVAAVAAIDTGRPVSIRGAHQTALQATTRLIPARLAALGAIALLGLSIAGLPLAVWLAIRWYFIEQAVLLDGARPWVAIRESQRAVDRQWLRTLWLVLCFGVFGAVAGPLLAFALLLGTNASPAFVNLIAGVFHTAVMPFTAVGLCLAYRDLQVRSEDRREREPSAPAPRLEPAAE